MLKRCFDIIVSLIALAVSLPLALVIAVLIKKEDGGPVLYGGTRVGRGGKPFAMLKFRTMVVNADRIGGASTADDDPRITRIGKSLRKFKLDELPQFLNVLVGQMSMVGPRAEVPYYVALFSDEEKSILSVRPGISDWASLWNSDEGALLAGSSDPEKDYLEKIRPEKIRLQLKYVREHNFFIDLQILWLTALKVLFK